MTEDSPDELNRAMRQHILHMVNEFAVEGHSGFSANYALNLLKDILAYNPVAPLTGKDSEWMDISEYGIENGTVKVFQNKRCSSVFKEVYDDGTEYAYNIDGKIFWEWCERERDLDEDEEGYPGKHKFKSYFGTKNSRVAVVFPYTPETVYEEFKENESD
jgi:hypothetical protein